MAETVLDVIRGDEGFHDEAMMLDVMLMYHRGAWRRQQLTHHLRPRGTDAYLAHAAALGSLLKAQAPGKGANFVAGQTHLSTTLAPPRGRLTNDDEAGVQVAGYSREDVRGEAFRQDWPHLRLWPHAVHSSVFNSPARSSVKGYTTLASWLTRSAEDAQPHRGEKASSALGPRLKKSRNVKGNHRQEAHLRQ